MNKSYLKWMRELKTYLFCKGGYGNKGWYNWDDWRVYWKCRVNPVSAFKESFTVN